METTRQKITYKIIELNEQLVDFLRKYSKVERSIFQGENIFISSGDCSFEKLPSEAISIQDKLFKDSNNLMDIINVLLINSSEQYRKEFDSEKDNIIDYIVQIKMTWMKDINEVIDDTNQSFQKLIDILLLLFPSIDNKPILIPDTNALYRNADIEKWTFKDFEKFTIILTPSVLKDLDKHKIEHRNETIKNKANKLINKIKEYRRRGKLMDGVSIIKNKIDLMTVGTEPDFEKTLKWLNKENEDDRLIAETLEIMRNYCNHPVILVTSDINLQNKCDVADLAYLEPPD